MSIYTSLDDLTKAGFEKLAKVLFYKKALRMSSGKYHYVYEKEGWKTTTSIMYPDYFSNWESVKNAEVDSVKPRPINGTVAYWEEAVKEWRETWGIFVSEMNQNDSKEIFKMFSFIVANDLSNAERKMAENNNKLRAHCFLCFVVDYVSPIYAAYPLLVSKIEIREALAPVIKTYNLPRVDACSEQELGRIMYYVLEI